MKSHFQPADITRFQAAMRRFDEENSQDPNRELANGVSRPRELVYAERLTDWVLRLNPDASEELRLAARCQHIARWTIPRQSYAATRAGYLQWREALKLFHAERAAEILEEAGYPRETVLRVQSVNLKKNPDADPDTQTMEDALCLVFLQYQLDALLKKSTDEKTTAILHKTWGKMSPRARSLASALPCSSHAKTLLTQVLAGLEST